MLARIGVIRCCAFTLFVVAAASMLLAVSPVNATGPQLNGFAPTTRQLLDLAAFGATNPDAVIIAGPRGLGARSTPGVLPPQSMPYGYSYSEWSVRWWQWAYSVPVAGHPLFDETGADCAAGQSGPVWFLGGVFNESGSATRDLCVVPSGKALFFPIINVEWDNFCPPTVPPLSVAELAAIAAGFMNLATDLQCEVDGKQVKDLSSYRVSAGPFAIQMPADNVWEFFGCPTPAGSYSPLVPDGIFVMLAPLSTGPHTIHFHGTIADPVNFTLDITYHLTVAPSSTAESADMSSGQPGMEHADAVTTPSRTSAVRGVGSWICNDLAPRVGTTLDLVGNQRRGDSESLGELEAKPIEQQPSLPTCVRHRPPGSLM